MTEFEVISAVMNLVTSHEGVTNTSLSPDQVGDECDTLRVRMMDEMDKVSLFRRPYVGFTQTIDSITVQTEQDSQQKNIFYVTIPRLVVRRDGTPAVEYIGGLSEKDPYRILTGTDRENYKHDMFINKFPAVHYDGEGRLEFLNKNPNQVRIIGVFQDPSALELLGFYNARTSEYPMPSGLIDALIGKTAESYLRTLYRILPQPNTQADIPTPTQPQKKR